MTDPYSVLGVSPSATDSEIKKAYRELARKFHPDNYQNNPLADLAEEKMKAINEAYETITKQRESGHSGTGGRGRSGGASSSASRGSSQYMDVRRAIQMGNLSWAEEKLEAATTRNAEWHFLMGSVSYKKGWVDEAMQQFQTAYSMEPNNQEYRQAYAMMQQGGNVYRPSNAGGFGMSGCDCCTTLICLNCLCR